MNKVIAVFILVFVKNISFAQDIDKIINAEEVKRIEQILASDEMQGRKTFTPGIEKAANFIADEFKKTNLQFFQGLSSYKQEFSTVKAKFISASGNYNGNSIESKNIIALTSLAELKFNQNSNFNTVNIIKGEDLIQKAFAFYEEAKNNLVLVDASFAPSFGKLLRLKRELVKKETSAVFILLSDENTKDEKNNLSPDGNIPFEFLITHEITEAKMANVIGIIQGSKKPDELVIFSGHYDHLGIGKANDQQDSIYNGANDDAAGTTAVMMLAKYFAAQKAKPERTLVFVAFTAEEIGGFGSRYFSKQINPANAIAMLNIEMIGTESKWGTNSAYITGYEKSDLGKILQSNLNGSKFKFEPDPYPSQNLFYRSDNATLAALGVPAHTISTSKMDSEKYYHTQEDELETLDMNNMAEIIKSIAISATGIISGKETPTRVEKMK